MKNWKTILNKEERKHLVYACGGHIANVSLVNFVSLRKLQFDLYGNQWGACRTCYEIAVKLGLEFKND